MDYTQRTGLVPAGRELERRRQASRLPTPISQYEKEKSRERGKNGQIRGRMENNADAGAVRDSAPQRDRTPLHRQILEPQRERNLRLRRLRSGTVHVANEV